MLENYRVFLIQVFVKLRKSLNDRYRDINCFHCCEVNYMTVARNIAKSLEIQCILNI